MYLDFYNLKEQPFSLTPDSDFLFPSKYHEEALKQLRFGVENRKGFIMVTGEVGCGKTTLCRSLVKNLGQNTEIALVLNSYLNEIELLKVINTDFNLPSGGTTRDELVNVFNSFLISQRHQGKNVVIIIDESQNLSLPVLEQLRMLSNLETEKEKLLQIILVGQPELRQKLQLPALRQLAQRITVKYHINPLSVEDTLKYILHRLEKAGCPHDLIRFTPGAVKTLHTATHGIPRMINVASDYALLNGFSRQTFTINRKIILEVCSHLSDTDIAGSFSSGVPRRALRRFLGAASIVLAIASGFGVYAKHSQPDLFASFAPSPTQQALAQPPATTGVVPQQAFAEDKFHTTPSSLTQALSHVLELWDATPIRLPVKLTEEQLVQTLEKSQFELLKTWAGIDFLLKLDRPFVLESTQHGQPRFLAVTSAHPSGTFQVWANDTQKTVKRAELEKLFSGAAYVPIKTGEPAFVPMFEKTRNEAVKTLQHQLCRNGFFAPETGLFSDKTMQAVKKFQTAFGLVPDGIPDREQYFLLVTLDNTNMPKLIKNGHTHQ